LKKKAAQFSNFLTDLLAIIREITFSKDLNHIIFAIGDFTYKSLNCENIVIWLWDEKEELLKPYKYWGIQPKNIDNHRFKKGEGIPGMVFSSGRPIYEKDLKKSKLFISKGKIVNNIRDILMAPIYKENEIIGVFDVSNKINGVFTENDYNNLLLISFILSTIFYIQEKHSEVTSNYQFFSSIIDIFNILNYTNSDKQFFNGINEVLNSSFKTTCQTLIKKNAIVVYSTEPPLIIQEGLIYNEGINIFPNSEEILLHYQTEYYDFYIKIPSGNFFIRVIDTPEKKLVFQEVVKKVINQYFSQKKLTINSQQFDLLYRISQLSLNYNIDTVTLLKNFSKEIYNTYKLYSFEIFGLSNHKYYNIVSEVLYRRENIVISEDAEFLKILQNQDIFLLNAGNSPLFKEFLFCSTINDKTVSLFATPIKEENINYVLIFHWSDVFSPEMNFFNFVELLKKEILAKEEMVKLFTKLSNTTNETINLLMTILGYKDPEIINHSKHVAEIAIILSELFSLNVNQMDMRLASYLHDIGKIGITDKILLAKKQVSELEYNEIKKHPEIGYNLIKNYDYPDEIKKSILSHHEKWNGKGYPQGISREQIPLYVRVITIADSIDAILSERPYKKKKSFIQLKRELKTDAGKTFDPTLITILLKNWDIFIETIRHTYEEN
jgi:putative nucleotidyltransferase with HDIG domain